MMEVEDFLRRIAGPTFVWRMAKGYTESEQTERLASAKTRIRNSEQDIEQAVLDFAEELKRREE